MHMITIFLILKILYQHRLNLKNSYKPLKILIQYNFLVPQMMKVLYYEEKLTSQSPPLPFSSISSTYSFLFSQAFPSLPLQTCKQSLRETS